ncbi:MobH family relaxase [Shewanella baltica]|uniref:MobH family relaxase n=1 Tax=Shewanella baltica TaxID=62322 RepID=UPI0002112F33|nr:MobH family relaxase [Shewanella baltica]AEH16311.1 Relaxase [Shewanella baltica OS117]
MELFKIIKNFAMQPAKTVPLQVKGTVPAGYFMPWTEAQIRADETIKDKIRVLQRSGLALPYEIWTEFVIDTVVNFALWVQELPASASYHHHGRKGLLYHSLDVAIYAVRIRRNYIMPPNTPPEEVLHREIVWVYGVFLAALFHDCGKIMDMQIELFNVDADNEVWTPALGPVGKLTQPYRFKYKDDRAYLNHQRIAHSFLTRMLSKNPMLSITSDTMLYSCLTEYLTGHKNPDNVIELIVKQADAASVAQDLGASKDGINAAAKRMRFENNSFAEQLHVTMTYLLTEKKVLLNKKGGEGFVAGEHLYLVCKPIADLIRSTLLDRGISGVPSSNTKLFNELQQHNIIRPNEQGLAVWSIKVTLTDVNWYQKFTCLCIHLPTFAPELALNSLPGFIDILPPEDEKPLAEAISSVGFAVEEQEPVPESVNTEIIETDDTDVTREVIVQDDLLISMIPGMEALMSPIIEATPSTNDINESADVLGPELLVTPFNKLTDHQIGILFWNWIEAGLLAGEVSINTAEAFIHKVNGQVFIVSPTAMKVFCKKYQQGCDADSYLAVQSGFQSLGLHLKTTEGRNIHSVKVTASGKRLNGFFIKLTTTLAALALPDNSALSSEGGE